MKTQQIGRLALRQEGDKWVGYFAQTNTMEGALWLGSIAMGAVQDAKRKQVFMDLMRSVVADIIEDKMGVRPTWGGPQTAPEHERSGRA